MLGLPMAGTDRRAFCLHGTGAGSAVSRRPLGTWPGRLPSAFSVFHVFLQPQPVLWGSSLVFPTPASFPCCRLAGCVLHTLGADARVSVCNAELRVLGVVCSVYHCRLLVNGHTGKYPLCECGPMVVLDAKRTGVVR